MSIFTRGVKIVLASLFLATSVSASSMLLTWDAPPTQPGVTITNFVLQGCVVPGGALTCTPADLPNGTVPATVRTWTDSSVIDGNRYCYAAVTLATGAKTPRSQPSTPPVCVVAAPALPDTPGLAQNVQAVAQETQVTITWDAPLPQPGVVLTGYVVHGCAVPPGGMTCALAVAVPGGGVDATTRSFVDTAVVAGKRYCYGLVTWGTGAKQQRSAPTFPAMCVGVPLPAPDAPLAPANFRATVP